MQGQKPTLWALIPNPEALPEIRRFAIVGAGQEVRSDVDTGQYVGTWQSTGFVFHLFEAWTEVGS